jgi:hypothetical protein
MCQINLPKYAREKIEAKGVEGEIKEATTDFEVSSIYDQLQDGSNMTGTDCV